MKILPFPESLTVKLLKELIVNFYFCVKAQVIEQIYLLHKLAFVDA